jgi:hypothetical protein
MMTDFEKLGVFYLGRPYDLRAGKAADVPLLYDSKDLVTHAVCVGMTGSGKTGLCIALLEEAAIDGIPAIVIDPKGDLANLLLTFPDLRPEDFRPWINEEDAARKGLSPDEYAAKQAETWKKGLESWGQDGARIAALRQSADFVLYTPGSSAARGVSILRSFAPPPESIRNDAELLADQIRTSVSGLLALAGIDADPLQSREHILLSAIVQAQWSKGASLDLPSLIAQIQRPPLQRVGVMDVDSFFPERDRFALAMRLNNLLASPSFAAWTQGEPLDVGAFLRSPSGKPRISIFSIAHLGDAERMFFVSMLLNQIVGWTRAQSGTTSLRAIVYMDEIFGYFPPVANPPSKQPLLTLLKQARAYGVGVVLATQNPVDLDYKGLSNCGTWFIGRLQTDRDKQRVLDGLEGAAATGAAEFNRAEMEQTLAGLGNRIFLMNNVHEDAPVVFETRWVMSYLRGPLTRDQLRRLAGPSESDASAAHASAPPALATGASAARPLIPPKIPQVFLPLRQLIAGDAAVVYRPRLIGIADVYFDLPGGERHQQQVSLLTHIGDGPVPVEWMSSKQIELNEDELEQEPLAGARFAPPPALDEKRFEQWSKQFADAAYRVAKLELLHSPELKLTARPGEPERDFRGRLGQVLRERRDERAEKLKAKYEPKLRTLQDRIRRAEQAKAKQAEQASAAKWSSVINIGSTILGALLGRRKVTTGTLGRAGTSARSIGRTMQESQDVARAEENVQALQKQLADLDAEFQDELSKLDLRSDASSEKLETILIRPKKTDVKPRLVALAWDAGE